MRNWVITGFFAQEYNQEVVVSVEYAAKDAYIQRHGEILEIFSPLTEKLTFYFFAGFKSNQIDIHIKYFFLCMPPKLKCIFNVTESEIRMGSLNTVCPTQAELYLPNPWKQTTPPFLRNISKGQQTPVYPAISWHNLFPWGLSTIVFISSTAQVV